MNNEDPHRALKNALSRYATGIAVVSCIGPENKPCAITVNSFASVSLAPPLVLWSIDKSASTFDVFISSNAYAVSVLRDDQEEVSQRFARHGGEDLSASEFETWASGCPILKDRLAGFDCNVIDRHSAGDHVILIGEVTQYDAADGRPLVYFGSRYANLSAK